MFMNLSAYFIKPQRLSLGLYMTTNNFGDCKIVVGSLSLNPGLFLSLSVFIALEEGSADFSEIMSHLITATIA